MAGGGGGEKEGLAVARTKTIAPQLAVPDNLANAAVNSVNDGSCIQFLRDPGNNP